MDTNFVPKIYILESTHLPNIVVSMDTTFFPKRNILEPYPPNQYSGNLHQNLTFWSRSTYPKCIIPLTPLHVRQSGYQIIFQISFDYQKSNKVSSEDNLEVSSSPISITLEPTSLSGTYSSSKNLIGKLLNFHDYITITVQIDSIFKYPPSGIVDCLTVHGFNRKSWRLYFLI